MGEYYMSDNYLTREAMLGQVKGFMAELDTWHSDEDKATEIEANNEALSIDKLTEHNILLSWGGPSDGYKIYTDGDNRVIKGIYYRADWGKYEELGLEGDEAERVANFYGIGL